MGRRYKQTVDGKESNDTQKAAKSFQLFFWRIPNEEIIRRGKGCYEHWNVLNE